MFLLVGFRQVYFFLKNLLGMIIHPRLTTAKILKNRDYSQAFLVFGLPIGLWLVLLGVSFVGWYFLRPSNWFFYLGLGFFLTFSLFLLVLVLYDFYWVGKYFEGKRRKEEKKGGWRS